MNEKFKERMMLSVQNAYRGVFLFLLLWAPACVYSQKYTQAIEHLNTISKVRENRAANQKCNLVEKSKKKKCNKHKTLTYYLNTVDFINSFIEIPTSNVAVDSTTISSRYLAGRAPVYNSKNQLAGTCSASFLCIQNNVNILTDISNYLSINNGLIVSWFTPSTLLNLELDSIVHSMVTECIVKASTKIGFNPFYGEEFNMIVSSDQSKIYFKLTRI